MSSPLPRTPRDIVMLALKSANVVGVGQTASAEDINDSFNHLCMMIAKWQASRINVYHLVNTSMQCTGAQSYTVGIGEDFNLASVPKIESAYVSQFYGTDNQVDYWLTQAPAMQDYNRLALKTLKSFPSVYFYDSGYPVGRVFAWPVPDNQYWLTITTRVQLQAFRNLSEEIVLPDVYLDAMLWNLTVRLCVAFGLPVQDEHRRQADAAINTMQQMNTQVPLLSMPAALKGRQGTFNIYGDNYVGGSN